MGLISWIVDTFDSVCEGAKTMVRAAKKVAAKTIEWLATEAETFVGEVKSLYQAAKPYIAKVRYGLTLAAKTVPWPWLRVAAGKLERALAFIEHLDNHPFAAKVQSAIDWVIAKARELQKHLLNEQEVREAETRAEDLEQAIAQVPDAEKPALRAAALINRYLLVKARTAQLVGSGDFVDFEHYLRVRAVQKLLLAYEEQMTKLEDIEAVNDEPLFIIDVAFALVSKRAQLDDAALQRLDKVTIGHFGKPVIPFVFEEMINTWSLDLQNLEQAWDTQNKAVAKDKVLKRRLELEQGLEPLPADEAVMLSTLNVTLPQDEARLASLGNDVRAKRNYVYAAEGFLQLLEKDEQQLLANGEEYLAEFGSQIGVILIRCAQNNVKWESLSEDEQALIIDFANIFEADCRARTEAFKTVEVAA